MKSIPLSPAIGPLVLYSIFSLPLLAQSGRNDEAARLAARQLTALQLVQGELKGMESHRIEAADLAREMLETPQLHRSRVESEKLLQRASQERLDRMLSSKLGQIPDQAGVTPEWLTGLVANRFREAIDSAIQRLIRDQFKPVFEAARESAVVKQRLEVKLGLYPSPEEVEDWETGRRDEVRASLRARMGGHLTLFEENESWIGDQIGIVFEDALGQLREQREGVSTSEGGDAISESELTGVLIKEVESAIERKRKADPAAKVYGVFPSVRDRSIPRRARELAEKKLAQFIESFSFAELIRRQRLPARLRADPKEHRDPERSYQKLSLAILSDAGQAAVVAFAGNETSGLFRESMTLLSGSRKLTETLGTKLEADLKSELDPVRQQIAVEQLAPFYAVVSGLWEPSEADILEFNRQGKLSTGEIAVKMNPTQASQVEAMLWEAEQRLLSESERLLQEGYRALESQRRVAIETASETGIRNRIRQKSPALSSSRSPVPMGQFGELVVAEFERQVLDNWEQRRLSMVWPPPNAPTRKDKYQRLFDQTRELIADIVTPSWFEEPSPPKPPERETTLPSASKVSDGQGETGRGNSGDSGLGGGAVAGAGGGGQARGAVPCIVDPDQPADGVVNLPLWMLLALAVAFGAICFCAGRWRFRRVWK